jgi:hypothetical protein
MCSNPSCGKTFTVPLKARNFSVKNAKTFEACPYCLTEVVIATQESISEEPKSDVEEIGTSVVSLEVADKQRAPPTPSETKVEGCTRHLGYLSQRSSKEKIPEECMMCDKIVQCMLQAVKG